MNGKILITGGAGFIGSHLANKLHSEGCDITILDRKAKRKLYPYSYIQADCRDGIDMHDIIPRYDTIYHLAAHVSASESISSPRKYWENNVDGTKVVLGAKRPDTKFFFASSAGVHDVMNPYTLTKKVSERHTLEADGYIGRFYNIFGPEQQGGVIVSWIRQALLGLPLTIYGTGEQIRDYVYVDNLLNEINFNEVVTEYGTGKGTSLIHIASIIKAVCNSNSEVRHSPGVDGDIGVSKCKLGDSFTPVISLQKGIELTAQWMEATLR